MAAPGSTFGLLALALMRLTQAGVVRLALRLWSEGRRPCQVEEDPPFRAAWILLRRQPSPTPNVRRSYVLLRRKLPWVLHSSQG